jgi:ribonuclease BN (tRNA processing enzyme)
MELIILGSGHFTPPDIRWKGAAIRNPSGYAVHRGGEILLFDLGFGNVRQIARAGLDYRQVSRLFLTHHHLDHAGDIPALLFAFRYGPKPISGRLDLYGPFGFRDFMSGLRQAHGTFVESEGYRLGIHELKEGRRITGPGWSVQTLAVPHSTDTLAYRLEWGGKTFVYTGDTGLDERLIDFAKEADLLLLECTQPDRDPFRGHLTTSEAFYVIRETRARRAVLTHLTHPSTMEIRARLNSHPSRKIMVAEDLHRVSF